jgi:hypothetical protein
MHDRALPPSALEPRAATGAPADPAAIVAEHERFTFPPFDIERLFRTTFEPAQGESVGVFVDLPDPREVIGLRYLEKPCFEARRHAWRTLFAGLAERRRDLALADLRFYAYEETGGSNLDLPEAAVSPSGETLLLEDALRRHSIVLYMGRYSATAPATALARAHGNRGATMHGVNDKVIRTGLAVDYREVSARAERLRSAFTRAERARFEWRVMGRPLALDIDLARQEAQKSHGLVRGTGDIANLPAGELYYVPASVEGLMPQKLEDDAETLVVWRLEGGRIVALDEVLRGEAGVAEERMRRIEAEPNFGYIGELGLGTQSLPFAGTDIQDEKVLGTAHLATGRSDHLGGKVGPEAFRSRKNAIHYDILYSPLKTPEIDLSRVSITKDGREIDVVRGYRPSEAVLGLL